jgi:hypothetical protein
MVPGRPGKQEAKANTPPGPVFGTRSGASKRSKRNTAFSDGVSEGVGEAELAASEETKQATERKLDLLKGT